MYIKLLNLPILFILLVSVYSNAQHINIIPQPNKVALKGHVVFKISESTTIVSSKVSNISAEKLQDILKFDANLELNISNKLHRNSISFKLNKALSKEAYQLDVSTNSITITASGDYGWFYGIQSLRQLVSTSHDIQGVLIKDEPQFGWRAYMLDESRYFHGEDFVKLLLDEMALLKMNVFHWHLVDDAGWRIEIKKYPKLTSIGSKRTNSEIETWGSEKYSGKPHSGFYTQEQIKELVSYAKARNITIVPEFEMPGHSSAAIAAYPWLGTTAKSIEVPIKFGRHYDNYDVTKPEVISFIKDVLNEMFELFPSEVIHIGGDEVGYKVWNDSEHVQQYMKTKGLNTPADLQIEFTNNISKFIESKGRRMMGWNEIMGINIHQGFEEKKDDKEAETELAQNVVVHFWKGSLDLATQAAQQGYSIVNSLHSNTYLDYDYKAISLEKAYNFNPIPEGLDEIYHKNIYGLGCQMWSEWTPTNDDIAYQTFPRIAAFAEVGWTNISSKSYKDFTSTLKNIQKRWDRLQIKYAKVLE